MIDKSDDTIKQFLSKGLAWEPQIQELIFRFSLSGSTLIDIGSHIGTHVLSMAHAAGPEGKVLAFEPSKKMYQELCHNLALNNLENVFPIRAAIGNSHGAVEVITPIAQNEGGSFVIPTTKRLNASVLIKLDDLNLNNVSLIKIDVENMEKDVLEGAIETITRCKPVMIIEIQGNHERTYLLHENANQMKLESIMKIKELNYEVFHISGDDYLALPKI